MSTIGTVPAFEDIAKVEKARLLKLFSEDEEAARAFWDEVSNEVDMCDMLGVPLDLKVFTSSPESPTDLSRRMNTIKAAAKSLVRNLNSSTAIRLAAPPNGKRYSSLERRDRGDKLQSLISQLKGLVEDIGSCDWKIDRRLRLRRDYVLAALVAREAKYVKPPIKLSAAQLLQVVFTVLEINTDVKAAIKRASETLGHP